MIILTFYFNTNKQPPHVIRAKLKMGGFSKDEIEQFFNDASSSETTTDTTTKKDTTAPAKSIRQDPKFKKFNMMIKMHLPEPVIRNKMKQAGISEQDIVLFLEDKPAANSTDTTTKKDTAAPAKSIREDPKFKKFNMMIKMHLPEPVIRNKMKQAGISEQDIKSFLEDKPPASSTAKPAVEKPAVKEVSFREDPKVKKYLPMLRYV